MARTGRVHRRCVQRYANGASDEEWMTMLGLMARADDPGQVLLRRALKAGVRHDPRLAGQRSCQP